MIALSVAKLIFFRQKARFLSGYSKKKRVYVFARICSLFSLVFRTFLNFWSLRNLIKQLFHSRLLDTRLVIYVIAYQRYAPSWLFTISYPTRAHGIIVMYMLEEGNKLISLLNNHVSMAVRIKERKKVQFRDYLQRRSLKFKIQLFVKI